MMLVFFLLTCLSAWLALGLQFEHKRSRFFPNENEDLAFTNRFFNELEQDDIFVLVGIELNGSVLNPKNRLLIDTLGKLLKEMELITEMRSLVNSIQLKKAGLSVYTVPILSSLSANNRALDSLKIIENPYIYKTLVSADFKCVNILLKTDIIDSQEKANKVFDDIQAVLLPFKGLKYHLSGFPIVQSTSVRQLKFEMQFYVTLSASLLLLILFIIYRSLWGLIVPFISLAGGMAIFFAYLKVTGQSLDLMSSLFPILMLIFLMADVVHLQTHYMDQLGQNKSPIKAMETTLKEIGIALFLTSFTTAVGFGTLGTSKIEAIRHFGLNAAAGVLIAFVIVIVFASSALLFFTKGKLSRLQAQSGNWEGTMDKLHYFNKKRYKIIGIAVLSSLALAFWGISKVSTNTFIKNEIPNKENLVQDFEFFEREFSGIRSFELAIIPANGLTIKDVAVLQEIAKLETYLVDSQKIGSLVSPTIPYRVIDYAYTRGKSAYAFPEKEQDIRKYNGYLKTQKNLDLKTLVNADYTLGRISGRQIDGGTNYHEKQVHKINDWITKNLDAEKVTFKVTGTTVLYDRNHEYLRNSLFNSLGLAFIIVGLLFTFLFRDYRMVFISIIPNIIPMLLAGAIMGFLGIKLEALTSIFFAISFGIAVDDTIHFLTRYKLERKKGRTINKSIHNTLRISGKAIIITSVILVVSFFSLSFSDFKGTYYIGVMVSITLFTALLSDLFLLPPLLYAMNGKLLKRLRRMQQG